MRPLLWSSELRSRLMSREVELNHRPSFTRRPLCRLSYRDLVSMKCAGRESNPPLRVGNAAFMPMNYRRVL